MSTRKSSFLIHFPFSNSKPFYSCINTTLVSSLSFFVRYSEKSGAPWILKFRSSTDTSRCARKPTDNDLHTLTFIPGSFSLSCIPPVITVQKLKIPYLLIPGPPERSHPSSFRSSTLVNTPFSLTQYQGYAVYGFTIFEKVNGHGLNVGICNMILSS